MTVSYLTFLRHDVRNIMRDPAMLMICFVPVIMTSILRWGYPALQEFWPALAEYQTLILTLFSLAGSIMPGLALAFVMLDEKDNQLWPPLSITPVALEQIVLLRIITISLFSFITTIVVLAGSGMWQHSASYTVSVAIISALQAPVYALMPAFFAGNKIEGVTMAKILNLMIMVPLPAFLFPGEWTIIMRIVPSWWVYAAFQSAGQQGVFLANFAGAVVIHLSLLTLVSIVIRKRFLKNMLNQI